MAKRRKVVYRTRTVTRRVRSGLGNIGKPILSGAVVGLIDRLIPINIAGASALLAGWFMRDSWLTHLGGYQLGQALGKGILGGVGGIFEKSSNEGIFEG